MKNCIVNQFWSFCEIEPQTNKQSLLNFCFSDRIIILIFLSSSTLLFIIITGYEKIKVELGEDICCNCCWHYWVREIMVGVSKLWQLYHAPWQPRDSISWAVLTWVIIMYTPTSFNTFRVFYVAKSAIYNYLVNI